MVDPGIASADRRSAAHRRLQRRLPVRLLRWWVLRRRPGRTRPSTTGPRRSSPGRTEAPTSCSGAVADRSPPTWRRSAAENLKLLVDAETAGTRRRGLVVLGRHPFPYVSHVAERGRQRRRPPPLLRRRPGHDPGRAGGRDGRRGSQASHGARHQPPMVFAAYSETLGAKCCPGCTTGRPRPVAELAGLRGRLLPLG